MFANVSTRKAIYHSTEWFGRGSGDPQGPKKLKTDSPPDGHDGICHSWGSKFHWEPKRSGAVGIGSAKFTTCWRGLEVEWKKVKAKTETARVGNDNRDGYQMLSGHQLWTRIEKAWTLKRNMTFTDIFTDYSIDFLSNLVESLNLSCWASGSTDMRSLWRALTALGIGCVSCQPPPLRFSSAWPIGNDKPWKLGSMPTGFTFFPHQLRQRCEMIQFHLFLHVLPSLLVVLTCHCYLLGASLPSVLASCRLRKLTTTFGGSMDLAPCNGVMNATKLPRNKQMLAKQRDCFMPLGSTWHVRNIQGMRKLERFLLPCCPFIYCLAWVCVCGPAQKMEIYGNLVSSCARGLELICLPSPTMANQWMGGLINHLYLDQHSYCDFVRIGVCLASFCSLVVGICWCLLEGI